MCDTLRLSRVHVITTGPWPRPRHTFCPAAEISLWDRDSESRGRDRATEWGDRAPSQRRGMSFFLVTEQQWTSWMWYNSILLQHRISTQTLSAHSRHSSPTHDHLYIQVYRTGLFNTAAAHNHHGTTQSQDINNYHLIFSHLSPVAYIKYKPFLVWPAEADKKVTIGWKQW